MAGQFYDDIIAYVKANKPDKKKIASEKIRLCAKYKLSKIPTDIDILLHAEKIDVPKLRKFLQTKPTRTISGVAVAAIMTRPFPCPHGKCSFCPGGIDSFFGSIPQSYTGKEPATMRAIRNNYDPYLQVFNRLEQYVVLGQSPEKIELIIMGGTFPSFPVEYKEQFITFAFKAMNDFSRLFFKNEEFDIIEFRDFFLLPGEVGNKERTDAIHRKLLKLKLKEYKNRDNISAALAREQTRNEKSRIKCVGLTIETRPDYAMLKQANEMLRLGCTRVELGVQSPYDKALTAINRGHDVRTSIEATRILKDLGFKINYHMMLGMPGISYLEDLEGLKHLFANKDFRPDMLKLYPCMVLRGTELFLDWQKGIYKPLTTEQAAKIIIEFKRQVPEYVRIMRVQRDIPTKMTVAGVDRTNLRQIIENKMSAHGWKCRCIRCREIQGNEIKGKINLKIMKYDASAGTEFFITLENNDAIIGFCRLRLPSQNLRKEITKETALIRELHVYGSAARIGKRAKVQHRGFGSRLLAKAEELSRKEKRKKIVIISGVGVRDYYRKFGYYKEGPYMVKKI